MTIAEHMKSVVEDRFYRIALATKGALSNELPSLAQHLFDVNEERKAIKGKEMTTDHLRQEAVKWVRSR